MQSSEAGEQVGNWKMEKPKRNLCFVFFVVFLAQTLQNYEVKPAHPHCQRAGAVVHRLTEVAVVGEPGRDQELLKYTHTHKKNLVNSGQGTARTLKVPVIDSLPLRRISAHTHLMEHVGRQADHGKVVNNEDGSEVDGLPVFHQAGSKPDHTEVEKEDESHGNWGVDQQPGVCPLVWNRGEGTVTESPQGTV